MIRHRAMAIFLLAASPLPAFAQDWHEMALKQARAVQTRTFPAECVPEVSSDLAADILWWPVFLGEGTAARDALLVQFPCNRGAYNQSFVYVLADQHGQATPVTFPSYQVEVTYADGTTESAVKNLTLGAIVETRELVNPRFDPDSWIMEEYNNWRGLGDAHSLTRWAFVQGRFVVMRLEVDASYDEAVNPVVPFDQYPW